MTFDLRRGDCLDPIAGLASLADGSVDHVISDPPYDEHTHAASRRGCTGYTEAESSRRATFNRSRELGFAPLTGLQMRALAEEFARVSRRWVALFCSVEMVSSWKGSLTSVGLDYVRTAAWRKIGGTPQFSGDRPAVAFEAIVIAHRKGRKRWNSGGKHGWYEHPIVLNRGDGEQRIHTTQKPLALMEELIADFTDPGDLILDPFAGSGTTGLAAIRLGRRFIGWELSEEYHAIATRRLRGDEAKPRKEQPNLFDAIGGAP